MSSAAFLALALAFAPADDRVLAKIPAGHAIVPGTLRVAPDGSRVACVVKKDDKEFSFDDGKLGTGYYSVGAPVLDPAGKHVAFRVVKSTALKVTCLVLLDGKTVANDEFIGPVGLDPVDGTPAFWVSSGWINNADGSLTHGPMALHYGKAKSKKCVIGSLNLPPSFSRAGGSLVSVGTKGGAAGVFTLDSKGREENVEIDASYAIEAVVNPKGREVAYVYCTNADKPRYSEDDFLYAVRREMIEGRDPKKEKKEPNESAGYESAGAPVFSDDGVHLAYRVRIGDKFGAVLDRKKNVTPEFAFVDAIRIGPKDGQLAYRAGVGCKLVGDRGESVLHGAKTDREGMWLIVHGEQRTQEWWDVGEPVWSPDGSLCAYAAQNKKGWCVRVGKKSADYWYDEVSPLTWADDGKTVRFAGVIDGEIRWSQLTVE